MKNLSHFLVLLTVLFAGQIAMAQGYALFPQEKYTDLVVTVTDKAALSCIIQNSRGEQMQGHVGDFLGMEEAEIVSVSDRDITLETVELVDDTDGNQREQRSRMQLPMSFAFHGKGKGAR